MIGLVPLSGTDEFLTLLRVKGRKSLRMETLDFPCARTVRVNTCFNVPSVVFLFKQSELRHVSFRTGS